MGEAPILRTGLGRAVAALADLLDFGAEGHGWQGWRLLSDEDLLEHLRAHVAELEERGVCAIDSDSGRLTALHVASRALQCASRALERLDP